MINLSRVFQNVLTVGIVLGFFWLIYQKFRGKKPDLNLSKYLKGGNSGGRIHP